MPPPLFKGGEGLENFGSETKGRGAGKKIKRGGLNTGVPILKEGTGKVKLLWE